MLIKVTMCVSETQLCIRAYPDGKSSSIMRYWSGPGTGNWHRTASAALDCSQGSELLDDPRVKGKPRRLVGHRLHETGEHDKDRSTK
jgi:hypothetical protein